MLCDKTQCTGCLACLNSCAKGAIRIERDSLGKTYPKIDKAKCVGCKLCEASCPVLNPIEKQLPCDVYAVWSTNNEDIIKSSSGGIATILSRKIISLGGVVCGAAVIESKVKHIIVDKIEDLDLLRGSKYVQSDIGYSFNEIKKKLASGQQVLFIGTPCQVAGLKKFLKGNEKNLLTVDLICHGVPPFKYLEEYLLETSKPYDNFTFRGINEWCLTTYKKDDIVYKQSRFDDMYFLAFEEGLILRDNCYKCQYATKERISDITVGDFWGLNRSTLIHPYDGKVSVMLVCTEKGRACIDSLDALDDTLIIEKRTLDEATNEKQTNLNRPSSIHKDRTLFEKKYCKSGFVAAVNATSIGKIVILRRIKRWIIKHALNKGE